MPDNHTRVPLLAIDDDLATLEVIQDALSDADLDIHTALNPEEGLEAFRTVRLRIVLVDLMMRVLTGIVLLERMLNKVEAIQKGARDYLPKPLNLEKLRARIFGILSEVREKETALELERQLIDAFQFEGMIGRSLGQPRRKPCARRPALSKSAVHGKREPVRGNAPSKWPITRAESRSGTSTGLTCLRGPA
jgi:DNA-binding NtrC family response regulator